MKLTRTYTLSIEPNFGKLEDLRYSSGRYMLYLQHFITQLYYRPWLKYISTTKMGGLASRAQYQARGIIQAIRTEPDKTNCPQIDFQMCPGRITLNKSTSYDLWCSFISQWSNSFKIPAKSHRALNKKLKTNWKLSRYCEFFFNKQKQRWFVRVFVTKWVGRPKPQPEFLGIDVGIKQGVARSDNYLGKNLTPIIKRQKQKQAERNRQEHKKKSMKTPLKQQLDIEVTRALTRCKRNSLSLAVEHPKTLANLSSGKLNGWARSYFARRVTERAMEENVYVSWINPAYTSTTCSVCGLVDKQSRVKRDLFSCRACGNTVHADVNAARNIARKGLVSSFRKNAKVPEFLEKNLKSLDVSKNGY